MRVSSTNIPMPLNGFLAWVNTILKPRVELEYVLTMEQGDDQTAVKPCNVVGNAVLASASLGLGTEAWVHFWRLATLSCICSRLSS